MERGTVLLTGSGGFLGGRLAQSLKEADYDLRLLIHKSIPSFVDENEYDIVRSDITDIDSLSKAVRGCSVIIHTAALVKTWVPDKNDFWKVNVDGLKNIIKVGENEGIERILYTSSFIALGNSDEGVRKAGDQLMQYKPYNEYEATKREALLVARKAIEGGSPLTIAIPGVIYGPGALTSGNLIVHIMLDRLSGKDPFLPKMGEKMWNFVYIDDVVEGHIKLLDKNYISREITIGGDNRTLNNFWDVICDETNAKRPKMIIPYWIAKIRALLYDEAITAHLLNHEPSITRGVLDVYKHSWAIDIKEIEKLLGRNLISLEEGIKRTYEWLQEKGLV